MADQFDEMTREFREYAELKAFANSQHKTIVSLSQKNKLLEDEIKHLQSLLADQTMILQKPNSSPTTSPITLDTEITDQEIICLEQLKVLKATAFERELTLEECKKVSEYSKILHTLKIRSQEKKESDEFKDKPAAELLRLITNIPNDHG